ncbi:hypothetical protein TNCT_276971 [Trichonephila clavata]|uniref:Uncharacterized protein n=1 Tax=Trichonephila clavata TaxID=2740835 RepID=A0A8X6H3W0_TRICU|nr:hypothetical protein TNCT_394181 [Trichonephila clavata]GFR21737.1 hypothetical protein TNCT_276971 [Trichonephila clavata]
MIAIIIDSSMFQIWNKDRLLMKFPANLMGGVRDTQGVVSVKQLTLRGSSSSKWNNCDDLSATDDTEGVTSTRSELLPERSRYFSHFFQRR